MPCNEECKQPLEAEKGLQLIAKKETRTSVLQPQGTELFQQLEGDWK